MRFVRLKYGSCGHSFHYSFSVLVCGGKYSETAGIIMSPGYPQHYDIGRQCIYEIESDLGKAIVLDFIDFDIEDTSYPDCDFDYLQVHIHLI